MVLATDGEVSFAFFIYGGLQWGDFNFNIGFRTEENVFMLPEAFSNVTSVSSSSNIDIFGVYLYRIDLGTILEANGMDSVHSSYVASWTICLVFMFDAETTAIYINFSDTRIFVDFVSNNFTVNEGSEFVEVCLSVGVIGNLELTGPISILLRTSNLFGANDSALGE